MNVTEAGEIIDLMLSMRDAKQEAILRRFFKTGKGQYGEGDKFLGLRVPQTRAIVKEARLTVPMPEIEKLLLSEWHEVRLAGFLLLVEEMKAALPKKRNSLSEKYSRRKELADFYLCHARKANNWDLVDLSCPGVIGQHLLHAPKEERKIFDSLSKSDNLWEQRILN